MNLDSNSSRGFLMALGIAVIANLRPSGASIITLEAINSGWYAAVGSSNGGANNITSWAGLYRDWLGFDLTPVNGRITGATLEVESDPQNNSGQRFNWWDVTTPYSSLGISSTSTYSDLGSGILFATGIHIAGQVNSFDLNAAGVASLNAATSVWAIGGENTVADSAFSYTWGAGRGDHLKLVVTYFDVNRVPEVTPGFVLMGLSLVVMTGCRRLIKR